MLVGYRVLSYRIFELLSKKGKNFLQFFFTYPDLYSKIYLYFLHFKQSFVKNYYMVHSAI